MRRVGDKKDKGLIVYIIAAFLDYLLAMAEQKGMTVMLCINFHGKLFSSSSFSSSSSSFCIYTFSR